MSTMTRAIEYADLARSAKDTASGYAEMAKRNREYAVHDAARDPLWAEYELVRAAEYDVNAKLNRLRARVLLLERDAAILGAKADALHADIVKAREAGRSAR